MGYNPHGKFVAKRGDLALVAASIAVVIALVIWHSLAENSKSCLDHTNADAEHRHDIEAHLDAVYRVGPQPGCRETT